MLTDLIKQGLYKSRVMDLYHRLRNRDALTVIMYHRVLSPTDPRWATCDPDYTISDALFASTVRFFKRHYNIVSIDDVLTAHAGRQRLPPRALLITFDDGWKDNVDYALPILQRENAPALLFTVADAVNRNEPFFQEQLIAAWRMQRLSNDDLHEMAASADAPDTHRSNEGLSLLRILIAALEMLSPQRRANILSPYAMQLAESTRHMVTADELKQLRAGAIAVGLHGKTHTPMTRAVDVDAELGEARNVVAQLLNVDKAQLNTLSFPHGRWTPEILDRARRLGYSLLFTSVPSLNKTFPRCSDVLGRLGFETATIQDRHGNFRPDWLALYLFRRPNRYLPSH